MSVVKWFDLQFDSFDRTVHDNLQNVALAYIPLIVTAFMGMYWNRMGLRRLSFFWDYRYITIFVYAATRYLMFWRKQNTQAQFSYLAFLVVVFFAKDTVFGPGLMALEIVFPVYVLGSSETLASRI